MMKPTSRPCGIGWNLKLSPCNSNKKLVPQAVKYDEADIQALLNKAMETGQQLRAKSEERDREGEEAPEFGPGLEHVGMREWGEEREVAGDAEEEGAALEALVGPKFCRCKLCGVVCLEDKGWLLEVTVGMVERGMPVECGRGGGVEEVSKSGLRHENAKRSSQMWIKA